MTSHSEGRKQGAASAAPVLLPQHQQLIDDSAINANVAAARGYYSVTEPKELVGLFGPTQRRAPALVIPVYSVHGEREYFQLRPDEPRLKNGRALKYETPAGARMMIDCPPSTLAHIRDPKVTLWITEGVRKADSLASIGLRAVALFGVWSWRGTSADGGKTTLDDWESIALNERKIIVCFDSDAFENPGVHKATERLGRWLEHRGAELSFVYLPHADDGSKQGVDDFLAAGHTRDDLLGLVQREWRPLPSQARTAAARKKALEHVHPHTIDDAMRTFERWLYLPDHGSVLVTLATIAANLLDGDPVWILLIGGPGGGKTEPLLATTGLPDVRVAGTLTEASLLSGTPSKDRALDASGGLLAELGHFGVVVIKDFTTVLSMNRDKRAQVLAALREIYDGSWTRDIGTDGGRHLYWEGKVGLLGGCTPVIDRHHGVMAAMGERFLLYRLPEVDVEKQAERALAQCGKEREMRDELKHAVAGVFASGLTVPQPLNSNEQSALISLATLVVKARSAVERDRYTRDIELIPGAESPTRLAKALQRLWAGADAIGIGHELGWQLIAKVALDSVPAVRWRTLTALHAAGASVASELAAGLGYPTTTTRRALEELAAHGVVKREKGGQGGKGGADSWGVTDWGSERLKTVPAKFTTDNYTLRLTVPAMSPPLNTAVTNGAAESPPHSYYSQDIEGYIAGTERTTPSSQADVDCWQREQHCEQHRQHPVTGRITCWTCHPPPIAARGA